MKEANFQSQFSRWLKYNWPDSGAFELKLAKGKSLPFSAVAEHQLMALKLVKENGLVWKLGDFGVTNPFDCFKLKSPNAYVVVMFYKRGQKAFYMIDIDKFIEEKTASKRKSLTEEMAIRIGIKYELN